MSASRLAFVRKVWQSFIDAKGLETTILSGATIKSADAGTITAGFKVQRHQLNRMGGLHGGVLAACVDTFGSMALSSKGLYSTGVSTDLSVSYLRGSKEGDDISVVARVDAQGRNLGYTSVDIFNSQTGKLLAQGRHTKFIAPALTDERNVDLGQ
ncbi:uncharacterized protein L969DRAFT_182167 [Mixia osmundae IAM 14324]|uniref:Thioesterase domain-containing protein n=1 Tax=Mixia osmundae (strain CBS 9802 / IAM 14324 / JCM 22182 / KY 12970) TaxID=764103 RepID=G7DTC1_MIXOS|nr:uncharacterized protein L969DRAFT_182167 [Mixia osmundae IAM 14324]KEI42895.1 hypothetical protein L969DRAFT_182167 [Mixia osmundae IAM 14324]GAA93768.1 hypothetical protein E5Q_00414 [Mixia osmundae IAM 14324]